MINEFIKTFGEDKTKFKTFVTKDLRTYNKELEHVLLVMAKTIQSDFIGKPINKVFINKLTKVLGEGVATFELETSDWTKEKILTIRVAAKDVKYKNDCIFKLCTCITFSKGSPSTRAICTSDNRFMEECVNAIIEIINRNRRTMATFEDAAKHLNRYIKLYEKAVNTYVRTMEGINPIFADISTAQTMSYCCNGVKNIELMAWENAFYPTVEQVTLPDVLN